MLKSSSVLNEALTEESGSVVLAICKAGTLASDERGNIFKLTEAALQSDAPTWGGGNIRVNHNTDEVGVISEAWYEAPYTMARIEGLSSNTRAIMASPAYLGVSQESQQVELGGTVKIKGHDVREVTRVKGTGVSLMVYPYKPACQLSEGCGVPIVSGEVSMNQDEKTYDYDVGRLNNAGRIVKVREIRIWLSGDEANDPYKLKERIASEAGWGQLGIFNIYPLNSSLQVGDEITDTEPVHVVSTIVSKEVFNPALNIDITKIQTEPHGGPRMDDPTKVPTIEELTAKIATLEARNTDLEGQIANQPAMIETAVSNALASHEVKMKEKHELEASVAELKSCMPVGFEDFMSNSPTKAMVDGMIKGLRSANPVGAPRGAQPADANALYSSGEELYKRLGVTPEQLAKYNKEA